jgi:hypothetical protein
LDFRDFSRMMNVAEAAVAGVLLLLRPAAE